MKTKLMLLLTLMLPALIYSQSGLNHRGQFKQLGLLVLSASPGWITGKSEPQPVSLLPVRRKDKWGFIDATGKEVIALQFDDINEKFGSPFSGGLAGVKQGDKWGFINLKGKWVIPPTWSSVENFEDGLAAVEIPNQENSEFSFFNSTLWAFINKRGVQVIPPQEMPFTFGFSEGLCNVKQDGKIGYMDTRGKIVIPCQFYSAKSFSEGLAAVKLQEYGKYGYIDRSGKMVIPPQYYLAAEFHDGQAIVWVEETGGPYYLIDKQKNILATFPVKPVSRAFSGHRVLNNRILAYQNDKYGFMDGNGQMVIPVQYADAKPYWGDGLVGVTLTGFKKKGEFDKIGGWFFVDKNGRKMIAGTYEQVSRFSEGVCWVKQNGVWGLIDRNGKWLIKPMVKRQPAPFRNGVSRLTLEDKTGEILPEDYYMYDCVD